MELAKCPIFRTQEPFEGPFSNILVSGSRDPTNVALPHIKLPNFCHPVTDWGMTRPTISHRAPPSDFNSSLNSMTLLASRSPHAKLFSPPPLLIPNDLHPNSLPAPPYTPPRRKPHRIHKNISKGPTTDALFGETTDPVKNRTRAASPRPQTHPQKCAQQKIPERTREHPKPFTFNNDFLGLSQAEPKKPDLSWFHLKLHPKKKGPPRRGPQHSVASQF